jgi:hypothetical protein
MDNNGDLEFFLDCSCGEKYTELLREHNPNLYKKIKNSGEKLYQCKKCGSLIGIKKQGKEQKELAQIKIYDNIYKSESKKKIITDNTFTSDSDFDPSISILSLHDRIELNRSRINFDLSKNFLKNTIDSSKIQFHIKKNKIVCYESDIQEELWDIRISEKSRPCGLFYLDYQMVLLEYEFTGSNLPQKGLIDSVIDTLNYPPQKRTKKNIMSDHTGHSKSSLGMFSKDEKSSDSILDDKKIYSFNLEDDNYEIQFNSLIMQKKIKQKYSFPDHNRFRILDPILGRTYVQRSGKLLAHSLGMDFLYFAYLSPANRCYLESVPTQKNLNTHNLEWKIPLNFKVDMVVEYDDFILLSCTGDQLELFEQEFNKEISSIKNAVSVYQSSREFNENIKILVERKNGNIFLLQKI